MLRINPEKIWWFHNIYEQHCLDQMEKKAGIIIYHISSITIITDYQRTRAINISDRHLNHNHLNRLVISMVWVVGSNFYNSQYSLGNHYNYKYANYYNHDYFAKTVFQGICILFYHLFTLDSNNHRVDWYSLGRIIGYYACFSLLLICNDLWMHKQIPRTSNKTVAIV